MLNMKDTYLSILYSLTLICLYSINTASWFNKARLLISVYAIIALLTNELDYNVGFYLFPYTNFPYLLFTSYFLKQSKPSNTT